MYIAQVSISLPKGKNRAEALEQAEHLINCWVQNGQVLECDYYQIKRDFGVEVIAPVPERTALQRSNWNKSAHAQLEKLEEFGPVQIKMRILGRAPDFGITCKHRSPSSYILFTTFAHYDSSLCCGDCFRPVPLYRIQTPNNAEFTGVLHWGNQYRACDTLQIQCGWGERFGLMQMDSLNSGLNKEGLEVCKELKKVARKPVYYFLHRYVKHPNRKREAERACPGCDGKWRLKKAWHGRFNFRCDKCELISIQPDW